MQRRICKRIAVQGRNCNGLCSFLTVCSCGSLCGFFRRRVYPGYLGSRDHFGPESCGQHHGETSLRQRLTLSRAFRPFPRIFPHVALSGATKIFQKRNHQKAHKSRIKPLKSCDFSGFFSCSVRAHACGQPAMRSGSAAHLRIIANPLNNGARIHGVRPYLTISALPGA